MDANILRQQQQQQQQLNSGLMRYRSAPSTLLANFVDGGDCGTEGCDDFIPSHHHRSSSPEGESIFARFMNCGGDDSGSEIREDKSPAAVTATATATTTATTTTNSNNNSNMNCQFMGVGSGMEHGSQEQQNGFSQMMYHQTPPPPRPQQQAHVISHHHRHSSSSTNPHENAYRVVSSMGMDQQVKMESGNNSSNLIRHSSSPAGLFSHLNVENGYGVMRGMGNFRTVSGGSNGDSTTGSSCRLKGQMNFSSGPPSSSSGLMSQISEIGSESIVGASNGDGGSMGNGNATNRYLHSFQVGSWEDSALENIPGLKRARDVGNKMMSGLNSSESQNGDVGNHTSGLTHHFSLPKTSAEMAAIMQFQDSVPCKIRAKRGCATHPRSIAERVRRTRISERMRKLQELVPNMDKQTNTADMLDLAVDYIKDLQKQVKTLSESRANCTCSSKQKAY